MAEVEKHDENVQQIKKPVAFKNKTVQTINQLPCSKKLEPVFQSSFD